MTKLQYMNACKASTQCAIAVMDTSDTNRKCYDATYKLVVSRIRINRACVRLPRRLGFTRSRCGEWCRQKPELIKMCAEGRGKRKRCSGGGMRPLYSVQEEAIAQRILHLRELHLRVLRKDIIAFLQKSSQHKQIDASH